MAWSTVRPALILGLAAAMLGAADTPWAITIAPDNSFSFRVLHGERAVLSTGGYSWGPNWGGMPGGVFPSSKARGRDGRLDLSGKWCNGVSASLSAAPSGERDIVCRWQLEAEKELPVLMMETSVAVTDGRKGDLTLTRDDGTTDTQPIPWKRTDLPGPERYKRIAFTLAEVGEVAIDLDPPCRLHPESKELRIALAADALPAGDTTVTMTWHFPEAVSLLVDEQAVASFIKPLAGPDWYPLERKTKPDVAIDGSVTDMSGWLDKPAGKHGGVRIVGDRFVLEDGTPIKFWGTNFAYAGACAPPKPWAEATAKRLARLGVNAVRMHKFTDPAGKAGISDPQDATRYLDAGLDRFDWQCAKLAENGIYYGFSHTYVFVPEEGNRGQLLDYDEIKRNGGKTYGLINYAEDVQDLLIARVVNLLKHANPYTGKAYAQDPALAYVELQNEDDIFFYTSAGVMNEKKWPKYTAYLEGRYADWLTKKYGSQEALAKAWAESLKPEETLASRKIWIQGNPWFFTGVNLRRIGPGERQRMLDNAAFFHDVQERFYSRMTQAIRDTGYQGPLCGSPWQAPAMVPHYYNLASDRAVGWIDRHNYFGGGLDATMLRDPGGHLLGTGLQQVADRPFGVSEWISVYPTLASAEGPAILAAYGLGLQGWDASFEFQSWSQFVDWSEIVGNFPWGVWNADQPSQLGQAPTLARMIMRGDVQEGPVISTRRVSAKNLATGEFDFDDEVNQSGDVKTFTGSCPPEALAVGRCVVEFTEDGKPSELPDLTKHREGSVIRSATKQLAWDSAGAFFTVDTPGTKGVVGYAQGKPQALGDATITLASPYASIFLTAARRDETLATAKTAIISAVARASNSGCTYYTIDRKILENGKGPMLLEPVVASIALERAIAAVNVLDHDGVPTGGTVPVKDGAFTIDGGRDHAFYYQVVFAGDAPTAPAKP